jgi:hypothetical protein
MADRYCGNCGNELSQEDQFCRSCGRPVHRAAAVPTPNAGVPVPAPSQGVEAAATATLRPEQEGSRRHGRPPILFGWLASVELLVISLVVVAVALGSALIVPAGGGTRRTQQPDQDEPIHDQAQVPNRSQDQTQGQDPFAVYTNHRILPDCACVDQWYVVGGGVRGEPAVSYNNTGRTASYLTIVQPPDMLNLHPGPTGQKSVVRWTAPTSETVKVEGKFEGIDTGGTTTDVGMMKNTTKTLFSNNINGFGATAPFSTTTAVAGGDTIDFLVGYGSNATYENDSTGLSVTITPAEPRGDLYAQTAVGDFSATVNPSGVWSYGYRASAGPGYSSTASPGPCYQ